jgi:hypothetical protein
MGLLTYLEALRQESEEKRRRVLWITTISIMVVVAGLWLFTWRISNAPEAGSNMGLIATLSDIKYKIITGWQSLTNK